MAENLKIPISPNQTGLIVIAHADDLALFCGGAALALLDAGWNLHVVRVTDDSWDSWGLSETETIDRNRKEFIQALEVLGIAHVHELSLPTDRLGEYSEVELRNQLVEIIRQVRPYLVMTFDPDSIKFEDNEDHRLVARATNEACWTSGFDKHPFGKIDQFKAHLPIERWYFGRTVVEATHQLEIAPYKERLIEVIASHRTMLLNMVSQLEIQARFLGYTLEKLQIEVEKNPRVFAELIMADREVENYRIIGAERIAKVIERFGEKL